MKRLATKEMRRRIALLKGFAQNTRTGVFGFAEAFRVWMRPRIAFGGGLTSHAS
jgi:hypothetical protein